MTVPTNSRRREHIGDGVTRTFNAPMAYRPEHIDAYLVIDGVSTQVDPADFEVIRLGYDTGSRVGFAVAPPALSKVVLLCNVPYSQETRMTNQGAFQPETLEKGMDLLAMQIQQLADQVGLSLRMPEVYAGQRPDTELPTPEFNKVLGWSSDLSRLVNVSIDGGGDLSLRGDLYGDTGGQLVGLSLPYAGAQRQNLLDLYRRSVSPDAFGAVGNGVADDTTAIQRAIDAAQGGAVSFTPGRIYRITRNLFFHGNQTLLGYGATILRGAEIDNMMRNTQTGTGEWYSTQHVNILGLKFDANKAAFPVLGNTSLAFAHCSYITIRDCLFTETPTFHQIEINSSRHVTVENCRFIGGNTQGLQGNEAIQLDHSYSGGYPWEGPYDNTACLNVRIRNCIFDNTGTAIGTHSHGPGIVHTAVLIEGCQVFSPYYAGVRLENWSNVVIRGNRFSGGAVGILAWAFDDMVMSDYIVEGNLFSNHGNNGFAYADCRAVRFLGQSNGVGYFQRILISNNTVRDLTANGASVATHALGADYCQHVTITGNAVQNTRGAGIYCYGSQWVNINNNTVRTSNVAANVNWAGIINSAAAAGGSVRGCIAGNLTDTLRLTNSDRFLVRGNNVTVASGLTNSGNTNVSVGDNLVDSTAA